MNLLPIEEKKKLMSLYRERLVVVGLYALAVVFAVSSLMLGAFVILASEERVSLEEIVVLRSKDPLMKENKVVEKEITDIKNALDILGVKEDETSVRTDLFERIVHERGGVEITGISYDRREEGGVVNVQGIAPNRQELVSFSVRLEQSGFSGTHVPVSSFVEDTNIPFALTIPL